MSALSNFPYHYYISLYIYNRTNIGGPTRFGGDIFHSRESFNLWILQIYLTSNTLLNLMMSFSNLPRRDCFRQVGFERRKSSVLCGLKLLAI